MENYVFVVLRGATLNSRVQRFLSGKGIECRLFDVPVSAGLGCAKGVKFAPEYYMAVRSLLGGANDSIVGYYMVRTENGKRVLTAL